MTPEILVLTTNLTIILIGYLVVFPRTAGHDLMRLLQADLCASLAALIVSGSHFMGTGTRFHLAGVDMNWAIFTLLAYIVIELPFAVWYLRRHGILG